MKKSDIFWQTYLNLEREAIDVSRYIFITDERITNVKGKEVRQTDESQLNVYSPHIADLLIRCCVQIEAISKELYYDNGGTKARGDNSIFFDEDCLKLIDKKWETHKKVVLVTNPYFNLTKETNTLLRPLKEAHKRQGTYWERAYQGVKHDRYSSMYMGNVKAFIQALAALYLLNLYYRKDTWITKYHNIPKADYSMGSSLFSVKSPITDKLWYGNHPINSESPYVVKYVDSDFKRIDETQKKEYKALNDYWSSQPELHDAEFTALLNQKINESKNGRVMFIWELAKYRLHKMIPKSLPFEEKKRRLLDSEAWNCWITQHNKHFAPEELTEDNIEMEIDSVGTNWGIQIMKKYQGMEWVPFAMNDANCEIYIPSESVENIN
jgi:uncharacterized protein YqeY